MPLRLHRLGGSIRCVLASGACLTAGLLPAHAQEATAAATTGTTASAKQLDTVIVTGRAGVKERSKAETSYSITGIDEERLRLQAPTSVTESKSGSVPAAS